MPQPILKRDITHWTQTSSFDGIVFGIPIIIKGRWQATNEQFEDLTGTIIVGKAKVMLESQIDVGDWLFLGNTTEVNPSNLKDAHEVKLYMEIPDLRYVDTIRIARL